MTNRHPLAVPPLDAITIQYLDRTYPERSPDPGDSEREVWMKAGERRLVRHLLNLLKKQEGT